MSADPAREKIASQLHEAIDQLRTDLVRVEMWADALDVFAHPVPDYDPSDQGLGRHLMPSQRAKAKAQTQGIEHS
jgi:hypothetical protein